MKKLYVLCAGLLVTLLLSGCAPKKSYDYTAFRQSKPKSILVLLPKTNHRTLKRAMGYFRRSRCRLPRRDIMFSLLPSLRTPLNKMAS